VANYLAGYLYVLSTGLAGLPGMRRHRGFAGDINGKRPVFGPQLIGNYFECAAANIAYQYQQATSWHPDATGRLRRTMCHVPAATARFADFFLRSDCWRADAVDPPAVWRATMAAIRSRMGGHRRDFDPMARR
jgi:hypothetical protein